MNDYETRRAAKIAQNQALLADLDIKPLAPTRSARTTRDAPPASKKHKVQKEPTAPTRTSARVRDAEVKPVYRDEPDIGAVRVRKTEKGGKGGKKVLGSVVKEEEDDKETAVSSKDVEATKLGWMDWMPVAPQPTRDDGGVLHFEEGWETFTPNKSPEEMLREGCFGGSYWRPLRSKRLGIVVEGDWRELPKDWVRGLNVEKVLTNPDYDPEVNKFGVSCGQSIEEWEAAGWIAHDYDIRGWFQWYCRFFLGRRCEDDERQVGRWRKCVGETGRWKRALLKQYGRAGVRSVEQEDEEAEDEGLVGGISRVVSQTCFHWAFEVRQADLDRYWQGG